MVYYPLAAAAAGRRARGAARHRPAARGPVHRPARQRPGADARRRRGALRSRSLLQGAGGGGRDRAGRRHGARVRRRRAARRLPRRQHLRALPGRRDRLVDDGALVFVKDVPDPENFGVIAYGEDGGVADIVEKAGVVDMRYDAPPSNDAVVGLYCYPPDVFEIIEGLSPSSRGELEITDVNRVYAQRGDLEVQQRRGLVARRRQALGRPRRRRPPDRRDGRQQVIVTALSAHASRGRARVVHGAHAREPRCRSRSARRTSRARARG